MLVHPQEHRVQAVERDARRRARGFARFARVLRATRTPRRVRSVWDGFLSDVIADADPTIADRAGRRARGMSGEPIAPRSRRRRARSRARASVWCGAGAVRRADMKSTLDAYERCARR